MLTFDNDVKYCKIYIIDKVNFQFQRLGSYW